VTPDGLRAVSGSYDKTLKLWDLENGCALKKIDCQAGSIDAVAVTPDGKRAISGSIDKTLNVWDLESGQAVQTLNGEAGSVVSVAVTPDGERVVCGSWDNTLKVWDLEASRKRPGLAKPQRPQRLGDGRAVEDPTVHAA
jgi:WD40 repeat protein